MELGILATLHFILWIVALVNIVLGKGGIAYKVLWALVVLLLPCLGLALYFLFGRKS